jgi:hypothetical protein
VSGPLVVIPDGAKPHNVIPGRRDSSEPGIFFNPARFRINAPKARLRASSTRYGALSGMT